MVKYGTSGGDINPMVLGRPVVEGVWVFSVVFVFWPSLGLFVDLFPVAKKGLWSLYVTVFD